MFKKVLIANRGEIAIRIARAAAALGVESVSVFAPADALGLHTRTSTQSRAIGALGGDPVAAYLDIDALIGVARDSACDSVHPGYGFLSENADFARACAAAGLAFIGPRPETLELFGDKVAARGLAQSLDIPALPGSPALANAQDAATAADAIGYPVMLKASAGGGGRGMRRVDGAADMADAFARCSGEAQAAFGDATVFLERLVERPRHIEVQLLADAKGDVIHLWERDCSVQLRNQKVVEIAPAGGLDRALREAILGDALKLAKAGGYVNAGTVEFLVNPERGAHVFIECNPRIQVEHTVTEAVTGVDLVEAQFRVAAGETLADLGLTAPPPARGHAVQARVVATGAGTLAAYKEPTGPGLRVDSCGYQGLTPPPQFDPMFAKLIATSNSSGSLISALDRAARALAEFHIGGLPTNLGQLRAILAEPSVRAGDARTTLLAEHPELASPAGPAPQPSGSLALFEQQRGPGDGRRPPPATAASAPNVRVPDGEEGVESPMAGAVIQLNAKVGDVLAAGDTLMVISAMKMETSVTAPTSGMVTAMAELEIGASVAAGQTVAVIAPGLGAKVAPRENGWAPMLEQVKALQDIAHARFAEGSGDPGVVRQRSRGKLTCRERIDLLLDDGSFREVGSLAGFASYDDEGQVADFTPANHVGGWGAIEGRRAVVCADDFTSRGLLRPPRLSPPRSPRAARGCATPGEGSLRRRRPECAALCNDF